MKIEIESTTGNYFTVKSDGKTSDELGWDELLGLVAALTIPEKKPCVHWMKTDIKNTGIDKPEENEKSKILIAIAYHDLGRVNIACFLIEGYIIKRDYSRQAMRVVSF